ncbi:MAG TPA: aldose 1-epimerase [Candidatus Dormibacteraeota bacterium]|nr:aldose 1-epimerase [Candidatus Dormibacteraeota bacterium]
MQRLKTLAIGIIGLALVSGCHSGGSQNEATPQQSQEGKSAPQVSIGGEPVVTLKRPRPTDQSKPYFLEATLIPGKAMNLLQIKAYLPGKGDVELLASPSVEEAKKLLDSDEEFGNKSFYIGGAVLLPYANRIRGKLSADKKSIETTIAGKNVLLPANWIGKKEGAERNSMHGLILSSAFHDVKHQDGAGESSMSATLHAGNFGGHWLSQTDVSAETVLKDDALDMNITATNVGQEPLPMGIGFHPYFVFPSGNREQARLSLPSNRRALVDNYDNVFPTGKIEKTTGTPHDFSGPGGAALGKIYLDDCFLDLKRDSSGHAVMEIIDPPARYGLRVTALSPEIKAIQVYAPPNRNIVAMEPQFNLADPYSKVWGKTDTGMVMLQPGASVSWHIRMELFVPSAEGAH